MKVQIEINVDNDAFVENPGREFHRILTEMIVRHAVAWMTFEQEDEIPLFDINGNRVGQLKFMKEEHDAKPSSD